MAVKGKMANFGRRRFDHLITTWQPWAPAAPPAAAMSLALAVRDEECVSCGDILPCTPCGKGEVCQQTYPSSCTECPSNQCVPAPTSVNTGAVVGGVLGGIIGAALLGITVYVLWRRAAHRRDFAAIKYERTSNVARSNHSVRLSETSPPPLLRDPHCASVLVPPVPRHLSRITERTEPAEVTVPRGLWATLPPEPSPLAIERPPRTVPSEPGPLFPIAPPEPQQESATRPEPPPAEPPTEPPTGPFTVAPAPLPRHSDSSLLDAADAFSGFSSPFSVHITANGSLTPERSVSRSASHSASYSASRTTSPDPLSEASPRGSFTAKQAKHIQLNQGRARIVRIGSVRRGSSRLGRLDEEPERSSHYSCASEAHTETRDSTNERPSVPPDNYLGELVEDCTEAYN